jgi:hypothetical protein
LFESISLKLGLSYQYSAYSKWISVASTFASTPQQFACNLLIYMGFYFLRLLIILWSQVQILVGPPEKQTLIRNGGGFVFSALLKAKVVTLLSASSGT